MANLPAQEPAIYMQGPYNEPDVQPYPSGAGSMPRGLFVILTTATGLITPLTTSNAAVGTGAAVAVAGTSGLLGMTEMDSSAIYTNATVPGTAYAANLDLFGTTLQGTALQPGVEFAGTKVCLAHNGQQFEISLMSYSADSSYPAGWKGVNGTDIGAVQGSQTATVGSSTLNQTFITIVGGVSYTYTAVASDVGNTSQLAAHIAAYLNSQVSFATTYIATSSGAVVTVTYIGAPFVASVVNAITFATTGSTGTYTAGNTTLLGAVGFGVFPGQQVGISVDPTSGYCVADPFATNKVATIVGEIDGTATTKGNPGDIGHRVLIEFNLSNSLVL